MKFTVTRRRRRARIRLRIWKLALTVDFPVRS